MRKNLTIQTQFRVMLGGFRATVLELNMPSSLHHTSWIMSDKRLAGLAAICVVCVVPFVSAQSNSTHYRSYSTSHYSSMHYRSAGHLHSVDQKPHSVPSSVVSDVTGKASGRSATSPNKELDQLEHASAVKPMSTKRAASPGPTKSTLASEKHSAPINFTHRELPPSPHSGASKIR